MRKQYKSSLVRERKNGKLCFGKVDGEKWDIIDPSSKEFKKAILNVKNGTHTEDQLSLVLGAIETYQYLITHPVRTEVRTRFNDILRAVEVK